MQLKTGLNVSAESIFKVEITGVVTTILENSVIVENEAGRHVIKKELLREQGYTFPVNERKTQPIRVNNTGQ